MNEQVLVSVHGYAGDEQQVNDLLPVYEHHKAPIVIMSPTDSPIKKVGGHICCHAGLRAYIGPISLDRQHLQLKKLLEFKDVYGNPFQWFLMNDSDSFVACPELPSYLFEFTDILWSNEVDDFRRPGESYNGLPPWPLDYHKGYPLKAFQPPYFCHRNALERMVEVAPNVKPCPICPFIDWYMVQLATDAGIRHERFREAVSCETKTNNGFTIVSSLVEKGALFIHSVKNKRVMSQLMEYHKLFLKKKK